MGGPAGAAHGSAGIDGAGVGRCRAGGRLGAFCAGVGVMGNRLLTPAEFRQACGDALARVKANAVERGDFELADVIAGPCAQPSDRDAQWIARNLGDVPMRIIDEDPMPAVALLREMGELADIALADAEARYANHLGRNP